LPRIDLKPPNGLLWTYYEDHRAEIDDLVAGQMHDPNERVTFIWIGMSPTTWRTRSAIGG
jgi:hypothetical protein